jgi:solute carrier family 50 protein (sugar transporter)
VAAGTYACFFLPDRAAMAATYGLVNNAILLAYYGAPLSTISAVFKEKSAKSIYFPTVFINGINGTPPHTHARTLATVLLNPFRSFRFVALS